MKWNGSSVGAEDFKVGKVSVDRSVYMKSIIIVKVEEENIGLHYLFCSLLMQPLHVTAVSFIHKSRHLQKQISKSDLSCSFLP